MDADTLRLSRLRAALARPWLVALLGAAWLVSQLTILLLLAPLGAEVLELQCTGFSAERYRAVFARWEATGAMTAYRAHFVLDGVHPVWYAGFFTVLLCWLFERRGVAHRRDWVLLLPLLSGLLDGYENRLQAVFLGAPDFAAIVDPLPLLSTLASLGKWTLVAGYALLAVGLLVRGTPDAAGRA